MEIVAKRSMICNMIYCFQGQLKEKKGKWKLFKRWKKRYFTLSGDHITYQKTRVSFIGYWHHELIIADVLQQILLRKGEMSCLFIPAMSNNSEQAMVVLSQPLDCYIAYQIEMSG